VKCIVSTHPQEQRHRVLPVMRLLAHELHIFGTNFRSYKNELCLPTKEPQQVCSAVTLLTLLLCFYDTDKESEVLQFVNTLYVK